MEEKTAVDWDLMVLPGNATIRNAKVREMYMQTSLPCPVSTKLEVARRFNTFTAR